MLYMVIERFKDTPAIYKRLAEKGRMMPEGLKYVSSWISADLKTCWQVMETDNFDLFREWVSNWQDLIGFQIVPVHTSAEMRELMKNL